MAVMSEVVLGRPYTVWTSVPVCVWDVGMNIGITSLFFAATGAKRVYAYEPVAAIYEQALANVRLNPHLKEVIKTFNAGIGQANFSRTITYNPRCKTETSTTASPWRSRIKPTDTLRTETVVIRGASDALAEIVADNPGTAIIAKLDCEGAEYDIIPALHAAGQLRQLAAVVVEWHGQWPESIARDLVESGFTVFALRALTVPDAHIGMLHASRPLG
jgi:FkbM family methyltransferase